jgi:hypothetical protein
MATLGQVDLLLADSSRSPSTSSPSVVIIMSMWRAIHGGHGVQVFHSRHQDGINDARMAVVDSEAHSRMTVGHDLQWRLWRARTTTDLLDDGHWRPSSMLSGIIVIIVVVIVIIGPGAMSTSGSQEAPIASFLGSQLPLVCVKGRFQIRQTVGVRRRRSLTMSMATVGGTTIFTVRIF